MLTTHNHPLVLRTFANGFLDYLLHLLCRDWGKAIWPVAPLTLIPALLKEKSDIFCLPILRKQQQQQTVCQDLLEVIESGPTMTLVSLLCTSHQILWIYVSTLFKCSMISSSFSEGKSSLLQTSLFSGTRDSWNLILPVKTEAKIASRGWSFPCPSSTCSIQQPGHVFSCLPFVANITVPFLLNFSSLARFNSNRALAFPAPSLHTRTVSPSYYHFRLLYASMFVFWQDLLVHFCRPSADTAAWRRWPMKINQLSWTPPFSRSGPNGIFSKQIPEQATVCPLEVRCCWSCFLHCSFLSWSLNYTAPICFSLTRSMRSNRVPLTNNFLTEMLQELSSLHSRNFLSYMLSFHQILGWLLPYEDKALQM